MNFLEFPRVSGHQPLLVTIEKTLAFLPVRGTGVAWVSLDHLPRDLAPHAELGLLSSALALSPKLSAEGLVYKRLGNLDQGALHRSSPYDARPHSMLYSHAGQIDC